MPVVHSTALPVTGPHPGSIIGGAEESIVLYLSSVVSA
jgi:hypothetical protein